MLVRLTKIMSCCALFFIAVSDYCSRDRLLVFEAMRARAVLQND